MKPHVLHRYHNGGHTLTLTRIALAPWSSAGLTDTSNQRYQLEQLEMRARELKVNVSTHRRSPNAPRVGSEWTVRVQGDAGAVELKADGDLLAIIAGALDDWETRYLFSAEELVAIQKASL